MNRLILVGNGFDLAHGLKTSYHDFIDDFWRKQILEVQSHNSLVTTFENDFIKIDNIYLITPLNNIQKYSHFLNLIQSVNARNNIQVSFIIKNKFLKSISETSSIQNWVDIENEYYLQLNKIKNPINSIGRFEKYEINDLNKDFVEVKGLLVEYLKEIDKNIKIEQKICQSIYKNFNLNDFSSESISEKVNYELSKRINNLVELEKENAQIDFTDLFEDDEKIEPKIYSKLIGKKNKLEILNDLLLNEGNSREYAKIFDLIPKQITFLDFNYTETPFKYFECRYNWNNKTDILPKFNSIHGKLDDDNSIIFGFGDDVDKRYQEFEDLNDNRYLENFKSIAYLQTANYKNLLEFVNSEDYQVFIFGHSCGISDRTMLNTIFEHENCKSVKPFYHKREDGSDNYTEIVQNISRNFNDKKKFRDRVVNKTYCESLT